MKELWKGSEAMGEAAIRAGLKLYVGYPITPQTEIAEYMSQRMPELDRIFIQSESELVSINVAMGASMTGYRSMTSSSGVGTSLMQEGLSAIFAKALPTLLINVDRCGCGQGNDFSGGQDDYLRDTRGGGNGDYHLLVYVPESIQEAVDLIYNKWDVAEKYRNPIEIMTEGRLAQMMEAIELPPMKEPVKQPWGIDGTRDAEGDWGKKCIRTKDYKDRILLMQENEQDWENYYTEDAETIIVALGLCARVCKGAVKKLRADGRKVGLMRPISAWPFPVKAFGEFPDTVKRIVCVEVNNCGQVIEDVLIAGRKITKLHNTPIYGYNEYTLMTANDVISFIDKMDRNEVKEIG